MPTRYTNVYLRVSEDQKAKIRHALHSGAVSVSIRLKPEDFTGEDLLALTETQVNKLKKAYESNKGATIKMSKTQIKHNLKVTGGFLPLLAGLAAKAIPILTGTVLPALATGALSGLASTGVNKIMGSGMGQKMYLKKEGSVYSMIPQGEGLYLKPYRGKGLDKQGEGLYIKSGTGFVDGRGLLLGQNNPISNMLSNIPILGPILGTIL